MKYFLVILLFTILTGCASLYEDVKFTTHEIVSYKTSVLTRLYNLIIIEPENEDQLYEYEDEIGQECRYINQAISKKSYGEEITSGLGLNIIGSMDSCRQAIEKVDQKISD